MNFPGVRVDLMQYNEPNNRVSDMSAATFHSIDNENLPIVQIFGIENLIVEIFNNFCISPYTQALTCMVCGDRDTIISIF